MAFLDRFRADNPTPPTADSPPRGVSGRGHSSGFLELEELNNELRHPHGHRIYDRMYRTDGDVRQVVQIVLNPIIAGTWTVNPYGGKESSKEDQAIAKDVEWMLFEGMRPGLRGHLRQSLPVLLRSGFVPFEKWWSTTTYNGKSVIVPSTGLRIPRTIDKWEENTDGSLRRIRQFLVTNKAAVTGREGTPIQGSGPATDYFVWYDAQDLVYYVIGDEGDNWEGVSLLRPAYKHWYLKDKIERIDAVAQEREALGVPICYPPLGASDTQLDAMEQVLANMRSNDQGYIVAPGPKASAGAPEGQGWLIEVIGYERTGSGRDPMPSLEYHTQKIAAAFISEFLRLGHGQSGARATAQVQVDPFLVSVEAITSIVEDVINDQIVAPFVAYNYPNAENLPELRMSQVDSTSLTQLADFVLKLTQVGALIPDDDLEAYLRERADLPPVDPTASRKNTDDLRKAAVTGGGPGGGDPNAPNGSTKPGQGGVPAKPGSGSNKSRDEPADIMLESPLYDLDTGPRPRYRELNYVELATDFDGIEDEMDAQAPSMEAACGDHVYQMARALPAKPDTKALRDTILGQIQGSYLFGQQTVRDEFARQAQALGYVGHELSVLDRGAIDRGNRHLKTRAELAATRVTNDMTEAYTNADLDTGSGVQAQLAAEQAGLSALRRVGRDHGVQSILHGRHDEAVTLARDTGTPKIVGVRYNAILDKNTCSPCREADDGAVRGLDDPVRLERRPPNPSCLSTASGINRCRCFETYEVVAPTDIGTELSDAPDLAEHLAAALAERGMPVAHAAVAGRNIAQHYEQNGYISYPGLAALVG